MTVGGVTVFVPLVFCLLGLKKFCLTLLVVLVVDSLVIDFRCVSIKDLRVARESALPDMKALRGLIISAYWQGVDPLKKFRTMPPIPDVDGASLP